VEEKSDQGETILLSILCKAEPLYQRLNFLTIQWLLHITWTCLAWLWHGQHCFLMNLFLSV